MENLLAARLQMASSLGFHIVFACIGIAMPFFMATAHWRWLKTGDAVYLELTRAWSKGVAIFFAIGAVSGTVLSFELGLLWPKFMQHAGAIIGMPFSWEGAAFFIEAIALGLFLYGWDRLKPWVHWWCGIVVGVSGVLSGLFVVCANAWMNSPTGFRWVNGEAVDIDPVRAMFNDAALGQGLHMIIAAFAATGFAVAGLHAWRLLSRPDSAVHRAAFAIALTWGGVAALIQPLSGDLLAKSVAVRQPIKLAAMEALFETSTPAPMTIGGIPDLETRTVRYGIEIPALLSFLAFGDFSATVTGLNDFPRAEWPPVAIVHTSFQIMVGLGTAMMLIGALFLFSTYRKSPLRFQPKFLRICALAAPLGFLAIEAGWTTTEVGRQPWIIYKVMKTADAVTPIPGIVYSLVMFMLLYLLLTASAIWLMSGQIRKLEAGKEERDHAS